MSEQKLAAVIVEDVTALEKLRAALLPLIDRVAICDAALADEMRRAVWIGVQFARRSD